MEVLFFGAFVHLSVFTLTQKVVDKFSEVFYIGRAWPLEGVISFWESSELHSGYIKKSQNFKGPFSMYYH